MICSVLALATLAAMAKGEEVIIRLTQSKFGVDISVKGSLTVPGVKAAPPTRSLQSETRPLLRLGAQSQFIVSPFDSSGFTRLDASATNVTVDDTGCKNFGASTTYKINATDIDQPEPTIGLFRIVSPLFFFITVPRSTAELSYDWEGTIFDETFASMNLLEGTTCSLEWLGEDGVPQKIALVADMIPTGAPSAAPTLAPKRQGLFSMLASLPGRGWKALQKAFRRLAKVLDFLGRKRAGRRT